MDEQKKIALPQNFILWMGELYLNQKLAQEQVDLANIEIAKLNKLLSTCKCERKDDAKE